MYGTVYFTVYMYISRQSAYILIEFIVRVYEYACIILHGKRVNYCRNTILWKTKFFHEPASHSSQQLNQNYNHLKVPKHSIRRAAHLVEVSLTRKHGIDKGTYFASPVVALCYRANTRVAPHRQRTGQQSPIVFLWSPLSPLTSEMGLRLRSAEQRAQTPPSVDR